MSTIAAQRPFPSPEEYFRISVADYHEMGEHGILTPDDRVELLDGYLVVKKMQNSPHGSTIVRLTRMLIMTTLSGGWQTRIQVPLTLDGSVPEPDAVLAKGDLRSYDVRHPTAGEVGLLVEVSDSTLTSDREFKGAIYARSGISTYWIINLPERQIEVYTQPSGPCAAPAYAQRHDFPASQAVPLILDGQTVASIPVAELLP